MQSLPLPNDPILVNDSDNPLNGCVKFIAKIDIILTIINIYLFYFDN